MFILNSPNNDKKLDFHISQDIIQGEEIPFYLTWKEINVKTIELQYDGFKGISRLFNVKNDNVKKTSPVIIQSSNIASEGYIGGLLETEYINKSITHANIKIIIHSEDEESIILTKDRNIYGTEVNIKPIPDAIFFPLEENYPNIKIDFSGETTIFLDIEPLEGNEITFYIPDEIKHALEKIETDFKSGLLELKKEFIDHEEVVDKILSLEDIDSFSDFDNRILEITDLLRDDYDFIEALSYELLNAIMSNTSLREVYFFPLIEYLESNKADKLFFMSPFLRASIPPKGGVLKCKLILRDILFNENEIPYIIQTKIYRKNVTDVSLSDIFNIRRV